MTWWREVNSREERMMVRAEYGWPAVSRVFIEPVYLGRGQRPAAVPHENVVEHEARQRVEGVAPGRDRRRQAEREAGLMQQPPRPLGAATAKIEVGAEDHGVAVPSGDVAPAGMVIQ